MLLNGVGIRPAWSTAMLSLELLRTALGTLCLLIVAVDLPGSAVERLLRPFLPDCVEQQHGL